MTTGSRRARDRGEDDRGETTTAAAAKQVPPFLSLFRYADRADAALMAVGTAAAVANGMSEPLMTVVFAAVIECFGAGDDATLLHRVSKVVCNVTRHVLVLLIRGL